METLKSYFKSIFIEEVFMILFLILFFALQGFVLFCCVAAGNDPVSQKLSDEEQMKFLSDWNRRQKEST